MLAQFLDRSFLLDLKLLAQQLLHRVPRLLLRPQLGGQGEGGDVGDGGHGVGVGVVQPGEAGQLPLLLVLLLIQVCGQAARCFPIGHKLFRQVRNTRKAHLEIQTNLEDLKTFNL